MTDLRAAAQQALEALEAMNPYPASKEEQRAGALTALRAALAQQAEPAQEPVGYLPTYELNRLQSGHDGRLRSAKFGPSSLDEDVALYLAPPQRKPLAEWQINDLMAGIDPEDVCSWSFRQGVYAAEKHHGVKL